MPVLQKFATNKRYDVKHGVNSAQPKQNVRAILLDSLQKSDNPNKSNFPPFALPGHDYHTIMSDAVSTGIA